MLDDLRTVDYCLASSRMGWILIAESLEGICFLDFLGEEEPSGSAVLTGLHRAYSGIESAAARTTPSLEQAASAARAFLDRGVPLPNLALDLRKGTLFQQEVWAALRRIPFGETRSYGAIAREIGRPGAARAVGHACGRNPVPLFVPCHRVVQKGGALGGFSGGLAVKEALLGLERVHLRDD